MFTEENPLKSPRRPSETAISEALIPDVGFPTHFANYLEDDYNMDTSDQGLVGRNSFCSQGSTATDTSYSTFSSTSFLSNYLHSFRPSAVNPKASASISESHEQIRDVKVPNEQAKQNTNDHNAKNITNCLFSSNASANNSNVKCRNNSLPMRINDLILKENRNGDSPETITVNNQADYNFADVGLIAYLPEKLGLLMKEAVYLFNIKPTTAKEFLIAKKVICNSPSEFADFIFTYSSSQSKLSKRRIGEFVGNSSTYNQEVLNCFLAKFDFIDMALDEAIRSLVRQFRLPGEAQQIDRILEKFATVYYSQNEQPRGKSDDISHSAIKSADVAYILSFSILMLNTDLHNPSVPLKNKMTIKEFIRNNRGINKGVDLAPEHLESLYTRIKHDEIKMDIADMLESDVPAFMAPIMAGYLFKLYHVALVPMWKKRWFILNDGCLYYFNKPYETKPKCIMPLENIRIEVPSSGKKNNSDVADDVTVEFDSRSSSMSNIFESLNSSYHSNNSSNDKNSRRNSKGGGRSNFTDNVSVDSSSYNDCVIILYGAASSGLLKSGKLSKTGAMTLAPRSKLVLKASSPAERNEWLVALQVDKQNFDPLKNIVNAKIPLKKKGKNIEKFPGNYSDHVSKEETNAKVNHLTRYDTEILAANVKDDTNDIAYLNSLNYNRRGSCSSNNSDNIDNEGSVASIRSFVSWGSDHSVTSATSGDISISPDGVKFGSGSGTGANGTKWGIPYGINRSRPKSVSFPYGPPIDDKEQEQGDRLGQRLGSGQGQGSTGNMVVDISAFPEANTNTNTNQPYSKFARHPSSSSIQSYSSGRSSAQSTYSASSEETMFGLTEILLEGPIWRYVLEAKLNSIDPTGQSPGTGGSASVSVPLSIQTQLQTSMQTQQQSLQSNSQVELSPVTICTPPRGMGIIDSPTSFDQRILNSMNRSIGDAARSSPISPDLTVSTKERAARTMSITSLGSISSDATTIPYTESIIFQSQINSNSDPCSNSNSKLKLKSKLRSSGDQYSLGSLFPTVSAINENITERTQPEISRSVISALERVTSVSTIDDNEEKISVMDHLEISIPTISDYHKNNYDNFDNYHNNYNNDDNNDNDNDNDDNNSYDHSHNKIDNDNNNDIDNNDVRNNNDINNDNDDNIDNVLVLEHVDIGTSASDLTGDSSYSVEYDRIAETLHDQNGELNCIQNTSSKNDCIKVDDTYDIGSSNKNNSSNKNDNKNNNDHSNNVIDNSMNLSNNNKNGNNIGSNEKICYKLIIDSGHKDENKIRNKNYDINRESENKEVDSKKINSSTGSKTLRIITNLNSIMMTPNKGNPNLISTSTSTSTCILDEIPLAVRSPAKSPYTAQMNSNISTPEKNFSSPKVMPKSNVNQYFERNTIEKDNIKSKYFVPHNSRNNTPNNLINRRLRSPSFDLASIRNNYDQLTKQNSGPSINQLNHLRTKDINYKPDARRLSLHEKDFKFYDYSNRNNNINVSTITFSGLKNIAKLGPGSDPVCPSGINISLGTNLSSTIGSTMKYPGPGKSANSVNGLHDSQKWKKMYVTLYADAGGKGDILFYFPNEEVCIYSFTNIFLRLYLRLFLQFIFCLFIYFFFNYMHWTKVGHYLILSYLSNLIFA